MRYSGGALGTTSGNSDVRPSNGSGNHVTEGVAVSLSVQWLLPFLSGMRVMVVATILTGLGDGRKTFACPA
jgi:hypothetical protein